MVVNRKSNFCLRSGLQGDHLKDLGVNGNTIFKMVLKNRMVGQRQGLFGAEKGKVAAADCEHGNEIENDFFYCCTVHFDNNKILFTNKYTPLLNT